MQLDSSIRRPAVIDSHLPGASGGESALGSGRGINARRSLAFTEIDGQIGAAATVEVAFILHASGGNVRTGGCGSFQAND